MSRRRALCCEGLSACCPAAREVCGRSRTKAVPSGLRWSACCADSVRGCPRDPAAGSRRVRTYSGRRRRGEPNSVVFTQVRGHVEVQAGAVCKTVGSAYVGSNPTPATTCGNGPLAAETRLAGRFLLVAPCIAMCHCESICRGVHGRIADGVRAGRAVGVTVGFPRTATDRPGQEPFSRPQVGCRHHAPPGGWHHPGRAGAAAARGPAVREAVAPAARGGCGPPAHSRGYPSGTAITEYDLPGLPNSPESARNSPCRLGASGRSVSRRPSGAQIIRSVSPGPAAAEAKPRVKAAVAQCRKSGLVPGVREPGPSRHRIYPA